MSHLQEPDAATQRVVTNVLITTDGKPDDMLAIIVIIDHHSKTDFCTQYSILFGKQDAAADAAEFERLMHNVLEVWPSNTRCIVGARDANDDSYDQKAVVAAINAAHVEYHLKPPYEHVRAGDKLVRTNAKCYAYGSRNWRCVEEKWPRQAIRDMVARYAEFHYADSFSEYSGEPRWVLPPLYSSDHYSLHRGLEMLPKCCLRWNAYWALGDLQGFRGKITRDPTTGLLAMPDHAERTLDFLETLVADMDASFEMCDPIVVPGWGAARQLATLNEGGAFHTFTQATTGNLYAYLDPAGKDARREHLRKRLDELFGIE